MCTSLARASTALVSTSFRVTAPRRARRGAESAPARGAVGRLTACPCGRGAGAPGGRGRAGRRAGAAAAGRGADGEGRPSLLGEVLRLGLLQPLELLGADHLELEQQLAQRPGRLARALTL